MQYALSLLALAGYAAAQGVTAQISPPGSAPAGCSPDYSGTFEVTVVTPPSKRHLQKRAPALTVSLKNGILTDSEGRTGYIASNYQFQFDGPPQDGAIYTAGWSACSNGSIALGPEVLFYQCLSGGFYNIYNKNTFPQCIPVEIEIIPGSTEGGSGFTGSSGSSGASVAPAPGAAPATQIADGQPQASAAVPPVTQIPDGQVQATTAAMIPITQISDGQIQATAPAAPAPPAYTAPPPPPPVYTTPAATPAPPPVAPITQITDGQVQATTPAAPLYTGAAAKVAGSVGGAVVLAAAALVL